MEINILNLRNSINKAYLKVKPNRTQIETFKKNIANLFDQIKETESEEFHKNIISEFLKNTYYSPNNYINTKGRSDLVIHNGKDSNSTVGVLFEVKKPGNKSEMPTCKDINTKAFHELILYYLRERITNKNIEIKYLVITNIFEWFIFNANDFEKLFSSDKNLVKQFIDFEEGRLSGINTDFFYKSIAEPFCNNLESPIPVTHFNIRDFETIIKNADRDDDNKLIALYKIFSPEHLLKLPFANDSNNLDKTFYNELLHIIGLEETKEGSKKLIGRKIEKKRNPGSLIENSITILRSEDCLSQVPKLSEYGNNKEEQLFNIALELGISWINRILFLKLLEGQLIKYKNGDKTFRFLNTERISDYDELNKLFFQVLAVKECDRSELVKQKFGNVPYLNSSLFEPNELEHKTIRISNLDDHFKLSVLSNTVLKDKTGKKQTGDIDPLQYLFDFLDSYDFSSEGSEDIQEENKTLINASVLGLIFEKINGYKDGSFFTPGFITMYMCHETIRRAVVQKFNDVKGWQCETISDVYNKIEDIKEADRIINSLRICDPAVGSGHFLVSALNEIIAIKSELKILTDREGKKLKEYTIEVINDELIITDEQSKLFEYNPKSKESQRIQEALFQEKQKIIENCLFGVDINPNSVKICRLRLWIELLKNAYYKPGSSNKELETLPNIDINIKCGNSLISRYPLDADIKTALKSSKWTVDNYREAVMTYRNAQSKDEKRGMEQLINKIKNDFETEVSKSDKRFLKLNKLKGELLSLTGQSSLFELAKTQKEEWNKKVKKLTEEIKKYETEIAEIKSNKIYENAFEWRFEFPEVLNNEGDFEGFDVVVGNPPYGVDFAQSEKEFYKSFYADVHIRTPESFNYFIYRTKSIAAKNSLCSLIIPSSFLNQIEFEKSRKLLLLETSPFLNINLGDGVFDDVTAPTCIIGFQKGIVQNSIIYNDLSTIDRYLLSHSLYFTSQNIDKSTLINNPSYSFIFKLHNNLIKKCFNNKPTLRDVTEDVATGISPGLAKAFILNSQLAKEKELEEKIIKKLIIGGEINKYFLKPESQKSIIYFSSSLNIKDYPNIMAHLSQYKDDLEDRAETKDGIIPYYVMLRPRREKLFIKPKILIRQTANRIIAAFDKDKWYCLKSGLIVQLADESELSYEYLLGLLNSKLMDFIYRDLVYENVRIFPEVKPVQLFKLPIELSNAVNRNKIENIVTQIINLKKNNNTSDISDLEQILDSLVYELYGLNKEEIRIIENSKLT